MRIPNTKRLAFALKSTSLPLPFLLGAALFGGCSDEASVAETNPAIEVSNFEPFGEVQIESTQERDIFIRNLGTSVLTLDLREGDDWSEAFSFSLDDDDGQIPPNASAILTVRFKPSDLGEFKSDLLIRTNDTNVRFDGYNEGVFPVPLTGTGVATTLQITPQRVDFRNAVVGTTRTMFIELNNTSSIPAEVEYLQTGSEVSLCDDRNAATIFCVDFETELDSNDAFQLAPGQTVRMEAQFSPEETETYNGSFELKSCPAAACEVRIDLTGRGVESGLVCSPTSLEFGDVNPNSTRTESVTCENIADGEITIQGWSLADGTAAAYVAQSSRAQILSEGDSVSIEVTFAPLDLGDLTGVLEIRTDNQNPDQQSISVPLTGRGGGPDIQVAPSILDFGEVSLIAPARRDIIITNLGDAPLEVENIEVDVGGDGAFAGPAGLSGQTLAANESQVVTVTFSPLAEGEATSSVRITSNDGDESVVDVPLRGIGRNLPPCSAEVVPLNQLNFGTVILGQSLRRSFEIRNTGSNPCLITSARLVNSDPSFSLVSGDIRSREIAVGSNEVIELEFAPGQEGSFTGEIEFSISDPVNPFRRLALVGNGVESGLFIVPPEHDFGEIGVGCATLSRPVDITNRGGGSIEITEVRLAEGNTAFSLDTGNGSFPQTLSDGDFLRFNVGFRADAAASYASAVEIVTPNPLGGDPRIYIVALKGRGANEALQIDEFAQLNKPNVDILFVVDKSGSMGQEQAAIASNFQSFIQFAEAQGLDYQLGVTSTDIDTIDENGRLCSANAGTTQQTSPTGPAANRIVTPETVPSPVSVFAANVSFPLEGGSSADESGLAAAELALTTHINGHNSGFVRNDAVLSIIFVSDEPDQSPDSVESYTNFFLSIKGFRNTNLFSASFIGAENPPGNCNGPGGSATSSGRYSAVVNRTEGVFQSICTSDWSRSLEELSTTAFGFKSKFFLTNQPDARTLKVIVDGLELARQGVDNTRNWDYDSVSNSVNFTPPATPEPGTDIRVEYVPQCL